MRHRLLKIGRASQLVAARSMMAAVALALLCAASAAAAEIMPHRALYTMSLGRANGDAGVTATSGTKAYQWGDSRDGWTVEQRYRLNVGYAEAPDISIPDNFVTC